MKFLCLQCDEQMRLADLEGPRRDSLTIILACPTCKARFGMLTNPGETHLLRSMDVQLGVAGTQPAADGAAAASGKCPISGMLREKELAGDMEAPGETASQQGAPVWTDEAAERLQRIPSFVRPMAKSGIEEFARQRGETRITAKVMDEARSQFGM